MKNLSDEHFKLIYLFFLSISLFALQTLLSPTLAAAFAGQSMFLLLAPPFLATAFAAFLIALLPTRLGQFTSRRIGFLCLFATPISMFGLKWLLREMSVDVELQAKSIDMSKYLDHLVSLVYEPYKVRVVLLISIPYFFYALYLNSCFKELKREKAALLIAVEMAGACLGLVSACIVLDYLSWSANAALILCSPVLGFWVVGYFKFQMSSWRKLFHPFAFLLFILNFCLACHLEPISSLHVAARDFAHQFSIKEIRRGWTTYSKVQTLDLENKIKKFRMIVLGDGMGIVRLSRFDDAKIKSLPVEAVSALQPRKSLVLFAGAGNDIFGMDHVLSDPKEITGVELNDRVLEFGLAEPQYDLAGLLAKPYIHWAQSDARLYLESGTEKFNLILFSWSGATISYYSGAIVHTTQFSFTHEAFEAAMRRLEPDGYLIILGASKLNILSSLKGIFKWPLSESVVIMGPENDKDWKANWDHKMLLVKNGRWTNEEVDRLAEKTAALGYLPMLTPTKLDPAYQRIRDVLQSEQPERVLGDIEKETGLYFHDVKDDRPFVYSLFRGFDFLSIGFYKNSFHDAIHDGFLASPLNLGILLLCLLIFFILIGVLIKLADVGAMKRLALGFQYVLLGMGSTIFQVYTIYRFIFFLGNPTWALAFGLGTSLLASALAAFIVYTKAISYRSYFPWVIGCGLCLWLGLGFLFSLEPLFLFAIPTYVRLLLMWMLFFSASLCTAFLFPFVASLSPSMKNLPWWLGMDSLGCALLTAIGPLVIERYGVNYLLEFGLALFTITFCLVRYTWD